MHVVTADCSVAGCPSCGAILTSVKERVTTAAKICRTRKAESAWSGARFGGGAERQRALVRAHRGDHRCVGWAAVTAGQLRRAIAVGDAARSGAQVGPAFRGVVATAHKAFAEYVDAGPAE
jgi:hypothetical protein